MGGGHEKETLYYHCNPHCGRFSVLEAADYLSNPAPPKLQGQVLLSQVPVEVDLLVKQADSGMREATEKFHFEADGT